jgi:signal transduction histidine kinase
MRKIALLWLLSSVLWWPGLSRTAADDLRLDYPESRELVSLVTDAVTLVAAKGAPGACEELRRPGTRWLEGERYVFVIGFDGTAICHPARPSLDGESLLELHDPDGRPILQNMLRELAAGEGDGWVHYLWPRPGQGKTLDTVLVWKSTYVRRAEDPEGQPFIVGSGLYQMPMERAFVVEQVNDAVALLETQGRDAFAALRDPTGGFRFLDAYIFVIQGSGEDMGLCPVNVAFPQLEGENILDLKDVNGKRMVREMIEVLQAREAAWVEYLWPRPEETAPREKSSYIRRVYLDGELLIVGAGVYFEEANL